MGIADEGQFRRDVKNKFSVDRGFGLSPRRFQTSKESLMLHSTYETKVAGRAPSAAGRVLRKLFSETPLFLFVSGLKIARAARKR